MRFSFRVRKDRDHTLAQLIMWPSAFVVICAVSILPARVQAGGKSDVSGILESISAGYDKRIRPNYGGPPVEVEVSMYVLSISSLSEVQMDFTFDCYFRQSWTDPRLAFDKQTGIETLSIGSEFIKNIWVPDTFFVNEKTSHLHTVPQTSELIRIGHTGSITRSMRLTITASCPMNLQFFPMDRQLCSLEIESFGYTMRDIQYKWQSSTSIGISSEVALPQFKVLGHRQRTIEISLSTGNYSRLACEIQFVRSIGYYLLQIYIPSGLIVIISWVSFWLNRDATTARVLLGVIAVLTMTTLMSSTNAAMPKISYIKSIDVYLGTCFVMVFASLLEYATVGYMTKRLQMKKDGIFQSQKKSADQPKSKIINEYNKPSHTYSKSSVSRSYSSEQIPKQTEGQHDSRYPSHSITTENTVNGLSEEETTSSLRVVYPLYPDKDLNKLYGITPSDIDKYSRIVFPVCFICFNLMYWIIYLNISDRVADDLVLLEEDD